MFTILILLHPLIQHTHQPEKHGADLERADQENATGKRRRENKIVTFKSRVIILPPFLSSQKFSLDVTVLQWILQTHFAMEYGDFRLSFRT